MPSSAFHARLQPSAAQMPARMAARFASYSSSEIRPAACNSFSALSLALALDLLLLLAADVAASTARAGAAAVASGVATTVQGAMMGAVLGCFTLASGCSFANPLPTSPPLPTLPPLLLNSRSELDASALHCKPLTRSSAETSVRVLKEQTKTERIPPSTGMPAWERLPPKLRVWGGWRSWGGSDVFTPLLVRSKAVAEPAEGSGICTRT